MKAICWGPTNKGQYNNPDYYGNVNRDAELMKIAGINVVRTYGTLSDKRVLDTLWSHGIWAVPTVYSYGGSDPRDVIAHVNAVKDHPAILMWVIGNEWNYNGIYSGLTLWESVRKLNDAAKFIKQNDNEHPVSTIFGEVPPAEVLKAMPDIDIWGLNSYRGISHGNLFDTFAKRSNLPFYLGEYGADAHNANGAFEDEVSQGKATEQLTREINDRSAAIGGDVLGGFLFEFNDEWWKDSTGKGPWVHDVGGIAPGGGPYPDMTFNEEFWGIVDIDRKPRVAFSTYAAMPNPADPP